MGGYGITLISAVNRKNMDDKDFFFVVLLFISVAFSFSNQGILTEKLNNCKSHIFDWIGSASLLIYLNHYYWAVNLKKLPFYIEKREWVCYIILVIATSLCNYGIVAVGNQMLRQWRKHDQFVRKIRM